MSSFFDVLQARVDAVNSLLCVGLDPHSKDLGADATPEGAYAFCKRLIDTTHPYAAAYKPNVAFFEALGAAGVAVLEKLIREIPAGIPVVLDAKRGDISTTAEAYADASFKAMAAHCVTINGYMGIDSVSPFTGDAARGVFVLCKTSNPSSAELQTVALAPPHAGKRLFELVAHLAATSWNAHGNVGLVVGATDVEALSAVRRSAPSLWILAPGVGFQGGDLSAALSAGLRKADASGMLLPVSRGISRAADPAAAARDLRDQINAVRDGVRAAAAAEAAAAASAGAGGGAASVVDSLAPHQHEFIQAALDAGVLRFGSFVLKSGRVSPYFFNAGNFRTGAAIAALGRTYARAILESGIEFDVAFGPAYKGIPLVTTAGVALAQAEGGRDVPLAYNRKEAKDHGEGGTMVGADVAGKRVLIIDDVISAGTAVGEAVGIIKAAGGIPAGVVIGLDRQERGNAADSALSAVQQVREAYGIPVVPVVTLAHLIAYIREKLSRGEAVKGLEGMTAEALLDTVTAYRKQYGVEA